MFDPEKLSNANMQQLALDLEIQEVGADPFLSQDEVQRRSMVSLNALKERLVADAEKYPELKVKAMIEEKPMPNNLLLWGEDFYRLLDAGWPWRVAAYIAWASSPKARRFPKTQEKLSTEFLGLTSDRNICEWRKKNPAIDEMIGIMQSAPLLDHRRDVFEALIESASDPSFHGAQDRKTLLTMTGDYIPHAVVEDKREKANPVDLSDAELDKRLRELKARDE
jgi:hypothetical protein